MILGSRRLETLLASRRTSLIFSSRLSKRTIIEQKQEDYGVTFKRYYIVLLYGLLLYGGSLGRSKYDQVNKALEKEYGLNYTSLVVYHSMYEILFLPGAILSTLLHNYFQLRWGITTAAIFLALGSSIKVMVGLHYWFFYIGQVIWAWSFSCLILASSLLAVKWFEDSKREFMIAVTVSLSFTGFYQGPGIVSMLINMPDDGTSTIIDVVIIFAVKAGIWIFLAIITIITFRSKPAIPPSAAAIVERDNDILGAIRQLVLDKQFVLLFLTHVLYSTSMVGFWYNFNHILRMYGFSSNDVYLMSLININAGIVGAIMLGVFLNFTGYYKTANVVIGIFMLIFQLLLLIMLPLGFKSTWIISAFLGFVQFPSIPMSYIYASEIAYPLKETTVSAIVRAPAVVIANIIAFTTSHLLKQDNTKTSLQIFIGCISAILVPAIIIALLMESVNYSVIKNQDVGKLN